MPQADILFTEEQIRNRVAQLGRDLLEDLEGRRPVLVAVLKGSVIFLADLIRAMTIDCDVDFIAISSYQSEPKTGVVRIVKDLEESIEGRDVVIVEDIVDTGLTLNYLLRTLETRGPSSVRVCTLINKTVRRIAEPRVDHVGFETGEFLVGYGLDFKGRYRNLPFLAAVDDLAGLAADPAGLTGFFSRTAG